MAQKPSIPKGTRDFNAEEVSKRNYIVDTIKTHFQNFGFQPIETPSFENSETLMGKYGDEGDRLIFKILNSGDYFEKFKAGIIDLTDAKFFIKDLIRRLVAEISVLGNDEKNDLVYSEIYENQFNSLINSDLDYSGSSNEFKDFVNHIKTEKQNSIINAAIKKFDVGDESSQNLLMDSTKWWYLDYINTAEVTSRISEKALRYDLTVPFARYVVQHQNEIEFPFKRYQIQPVWRADRPQKGRFREFYQCDADVVGSQSLWQEVEFVQLYDAVFTSLKLEGVTIKINNRKVLSGIAEVIGAQDKLIDFTVALDKLDKIGEEKVKQEMRDKNISEEGISKLQPLFDLKGSFGQQIEGLKSILSTSEVGNKGIEELEFINQGISALGLKTSKLELDVTLARGLNYYTGAIFEVAAPKGVKMGSIGGGGRYDDLTSIFGKPDTSGVGISFGLDRIYLVLEELGLFPEAVTENTKVLFINFGDKEALACLKAIKALRENDIKSELYPDAAKMKKQMTHADRRQIPFVVLVGEEELKANVFTLKNMKSGEQSKLSLSELISHLS